MKHKCASPRIGHLSKRHEVGSFLLVMCINTLKFSLPTNMADIFEPVHEISNIVEFWHV